jgi:RNA polymerase sigma factor (sigma-70 family)
MDEPQRELLDAVAAHDESACAALIRLVEPFIRAALATRNFASGDDQDDVLQQVRCTILDRVRQFDPARGKFVSWVYGILRNTYNSYVRTVQRRAETPFSHLPTRVGPGKSNTGDDPTDEEEPADPLENVEAHAGTSLALEGEPPALLGALAAVRDQLTGDDRVVADHMVLHGGGFGTHHDLAIALNISDAAAKQRAYRMKRYLKTAIEERIASERYLLTKKGRST